MDIGRAARPRLRRAAAVAGLFGAVLLGAPPGLAIGPETPVEFVVDYMAEGYMVMVIEPAAVAELNVTRLIYRDGEPVVRERLVLNELKTQDYTRPFTKPEDFQYRAPDEGAPPKPQREGKLEPQKLRQDAPANVEAQQTLQRLAKPSVAAQRQAIVDGPPKRFGVLIPLVVDSFMKLEDGPYAEKFVAEARLVGEDPKGKPLTVIRWAHFIMTERQPRFVSPEEYSRIVDPPTEGVDPLGQKIELNLGRGAAAQMPLEKTKLNAAVPLGRLGGAQPEKPDAAASSLEGAKSEANER
jgi:hypothetical protein